MRRLSNGNRCLLTPRQWEVANLMYEGCNSREIAQIAGMSTASVKSHVLRVYERLQVSNRSEFVRLFGEILSRSRREDCELPE